MFGPRDSVRASGAMLFNRQPTTDNQPYFNLSIPKAFITYFS